MTVFTKILRTTNSQFIGPFYSTASDPFNAQFNTQFGPVPTSSANSPFTGDFSADFGTGSAQPAPVSGYIAVRVNKILKLLDTEVVHATPLRFASHFPVYHVSSGQASSLTPLHIVWQRLTVLTAAVVFLLPSGPRHIVAPVKAPGVIALRRLTSRTITGVPAPSLASLIRQFSHPMLLTGAMISHLARGAILVRAAPTAAQAAVVRLPGKAMQAGLSAASALARAPSRLLSAVSGSLAHIVRAFPYRVGAVSPENARVTFGGGNFFARAFGAPSAEVPSLLRGQAIQRGGASANAAQSTRAPGRVLAAASVAAAALIRSAGLLRHAASPAATLFQRQAGLVRGVISGTLQAASPAGLHIRSFVATSSQIAASLPLRVVGRSLSLPRLQSSSVSISSVQTLLRALSAASGQTGAIARGIARGLLGAASASAQASVRTAGRLCAAASANLAALLTLAAHVLILRVAATGVVALRASYTRLCAAINAQVVRLVARHGVFLAVLSANVGSIQRRLVRLIGVASTQALTVARYIGRALALLNPQVVAAIRGLYRFPSVLSPQTTAALARRGSSFAGAASTQAAALGRTTAKTLAGFILQVAASGHVNRRILATATASLAALLHPRGLILRTAQAQRGKLIHWFHLFVAPWASQQTTLLPPGGGPAEPPSFGPIDPQDQTIFGFDWSSRAAPGDPIATATVVSVPPGMTFIGPVFVSGYLVQVTAAPFTPPQGVPATLALRCTCSFASGRVSSFSIPVPVRFL